LKNILLLVHDDAGQEARFQAALDVTRALEGHLSCLDVVMVPTLAAADYWSGSGTAMLLEEERNAEATNRSRLSERLRREDVQWSWIDATGDLALCIERAAILSELIVVNRRLDGFPYPDTRTLASDLVVRSGKPILAVPDGVTGFAASGSALVAWDGSREADAALQAAAPLLKLATDVTLIEIDDGSIAIKAEHAASFLSRHGIHPRVQREPGRSGVDNVLLQQIAVHEADYLVMGGFGHSRLSEALMGGVSRTMLTRCPVPLFLAH